MILLQQALQITRERVGVVIPVYLPAARVDAEQGNTLLEDTVRAYCAQLADPAHICVSVDGAAYGAERASQLAQRYGVQVHVAAENRGKMHAAIHGVSRLLGDAALQYIAVVDQDGDHFANELLNLVRAAAHIAAETGSEHVLILGQRASRHHPLGWLRGELEELADRMLLDALAYHAARTGQPLRLEFATPLAEFPDFHSGYKLFSRATATAVFCAPPILAGVSEDGYYRHACEAVMSVEALVRGAYLGIVRRSAFNVQPLSTFGLFNRQQLTADMIIWPCKRLGVPAAFVRQWLRNHSARLQLATLTPEGRDELRAIHALVMAAFGEDTDVQLQGPLFV